MYIYGIAISVVALVIVVPLIVIPSVSGASWLGSVGELTFLQPLFILAAIGVAFGAIMALFR